MKYFFYALMLAGSYMTRAESVSLMNSIGDFQNFPQVHGKTNSSLENCKSEFAQMRDRAFNELAMKTIAAKCAEFNCANSPSRKCWVPTLTLTPVK